MKHLTRLLALLLALCLLPALALADKTFVDNRQPVTDAPAPTAEPGVIPSTQEDPHPPKPGEATAAPAPLAPDAPELPEADTPEAPDYDLEAALAALPEGLSAMGRKQVEVYLRNLIDLGGAYTDALDRAYDLLQEDDIVAAWNALSSHIGMFRPMEPTVEGVRFVDYDSAIQYWLDRAENDTPTVDLPVKLSDGYYLMAYALSSDEQYDGALELLAEADRLSPANAAVQFERAYAIGLLDDMDASLAFAREGLRCALTHEELARGYRTAGYSLVERGDHRLAACLYTASLDFSEDDALALDELQYIAEQSPKAAEGLTDELVRETLAENGFVYGLSAEAQAAMARYRDSGATDYASELIMAEWE